MKSIIKLFLFLFLSFYTALGINNHIPQYNVPVTQIVLKSAQELGNNSNSNNYAIVAQNSPSPTEFITQSRRKFQSYNNAFDKFLRITNNFEQLIYIKNKISQTSFHNITYYHLKNEIHTRAP